MCTTATATAPAPVKTVGHPSKASSSPSYLQVPTWLAVGLVATAVLPAWLAGQQLGSDPLFATTYNEDNTIRSTSSHRESLNKGSIIPFIALDVTTAGQQEEEGDDEDTVGHEFFLNLQQVRPALLQSEDALVDVLKEMAALTVHQEMDAYFCHYHLGLNCLGSLQDGGHVSLHTWAKDRTLVADVFVRDEESVVLPQQEWVDKLTHLFYDEENPRPTVATGAVATPQWTMHKRGHEFEEEHSDLDRFLQDPPELKDVVASHTTTFQRVDVVDFNALSTRQDMEAYAKEDPEYLRRNPELFLPDRSMFLDGVLQSTRFGDAPYHEALVHPALMAHPHPKKVAIIGGGECATLREILKHDTVEEVVMIEIDEGVVTVSKEFLPDWNDCSFLEGGTRYCMDDPRVRMQHEDAFAWFMNRFLPAGDSGETKMEETPFDVIITDALDPQNVVDFAAALYGDASFLKSLYNALTDEGILLTQVGNAPTLREPPEQYTLNKNRQVFVDSLTTQGFQSIMDYQEEHTFFEEPWFFYSAFKQVETAARWFNNEAIINAEIQKRLRPTVSGESPLRYFDGATMQGYQYPTRGSRHVFCLREPTPESCLDGDGFDPTYGNTPEALLEIRQSVMGDGVGRGVYTSVDIPTESYVALETSVQPTTFEIPTTELIYKMSEIDLYDDEVATILDGYMDGYGYSAKSFGSRPKIRVDSGMTTFMNHGCDGTNNVGDIDGPNEQTVSLDEFPESYLHLSLLGAESVYNPALVRSGSDQATIEPSRDIVAGEELMDNYLGFNVRQADWRRNVEALRRMCSGELGEVSSYERDGYVSFHDQYYEDKRRIAQQQLDEENTTTEG